MYPENICLQCGETSNDTYSRIIRDSCGHYKCRVCLLQEDIECNACKYGNKKQNIVGKGSTGLNCKTNAKHSKFESEKNTGHSKFESEHGTKHPKFELEKNTKLLILGSEKNVKHSKFESEKNNATEDSNDLIQNGRNILATPVDKSDRSNLNIVFNGVAPQSEAPVNLVTKNKETVINLRGKHEKKSKRKEKNKNKQIIKRSPPKALPAHILLETDADQKKMYFCKACDKRFKSRNYVGHHSYCHLTPPITCSICREVFLLRAQFYYHMNMHSGNRVYICDACNVLFHQKNKLIRHLCTHNDNRTHKCAECSATFNNPTSLKKHTLVHSNLKPFTCKTCKKTFRDSSNLRKHQLNHLGVKYDCKVCGKRYSMRWSLTVHLKSHRMEKQHACSSCTKSFYTNKDLQRHQLTHTEIKQFQCSVCKVYFRRKDNLDRHLRNAHTDPDSQSGNTNTADNTESAIPDNAPETGSLELLTENLQNPGCSVIVNKQVKKIDTPTVCENLQTLHASSNVEIQSVHEVNSAPCEPAVVQEPVNRKEILEANFLRSSVICMSISTSKPTNNSSVISSNESNLPEQSQKVSNVETALQNTPEKSYCFKIPPLTKFASSQETKNVSSEVNNVDLDERQNGEGKARNDNVNQTKAQSENGLSGNTSLKNRCYETHDAVVYVHKKVNYDMKKYASQSDYHYDKLFAIDDSIKSKGFVKSKYSPESIELYKKILIPSYKSNLVTNKAKQGNALEGKRSEQDLAGCNMGRDVPPLRTIERRSASFSNPPSVYGGRRDVTDEHVLTEEEIQMNAIRMKAEIFLRSDDHWKRRLAHNLDET